MATLQTLAATGVHGNGASALPLTVTVAMLQLLVSMEMVRRPFHRPPVTAATLQLLAATGVHGNGAKVLPSVDCYRGNAAAPGSDWFPWEWR